MQAPQEQERPFLPDGVPQVTQAPSVPSVTVE